MILVKPTNGDECRLPSGLLISGISEVEKTTEVARALRFNDLEIVDREKEIVKEDSIQYKIVDDVDIEGEML